MATYVTKEQLAQVATAIGTQSDARFAKIAYEALVDTLIGSDEDKSVREIANEELVAALIPEDAQEAMDTLAEISAWIQSHPAEAAAINAKLTLGVPAYIKATGKYKSGTTYYTDANGSATVDTTSFVVDETDVSNYYVANTEGIQYSTVKAYVEAYVAAQIGGAALSGGNGISISNGTVSGVVDSSNANGLSVGTNGFAMATATASTSGEGGSNGAMSATDKEKLDNADVTAYTGTGAISVSNHEISVAAASASTSGVGGNAGTMSAADKEKLDNADVTAYSGTGAISVSEHVISVGAASASTSGVGGSAGTMSAADKEKLDNADVTAYTAGNGIDITSHAVAAKIDSSNARGLSVGANGIALALATADTYSSGTKTADGTAGALSSADKYKLDQIGTATSEDISDIIDNIFSDGTDGD